MIRPAALVCVLALGCDGSATHDHPLHTPTTIGCGTLTIQCKLQAIDQVTDPKHWALFAEQAPPAGYRELHHTAALFDVKDVDEVRAHYYGFDAWRWDATSVDDGVPGCGHRAVGSDGTLCPTVVLPGLDVGVARGRQLAALFNAPRPSPPVVVMCVPQPTLAFVYYRKGVPVGEIDVDLGCPRWEAWPGFEQTFQSSATRDAFVGLCKDAGLPLCDLRDSEDEQAWATWKATNVEPLPAPLNLPSLDRRRKPRPLPVSGTSLLSRLSEEERLRLCVWNTQHVGVRRAPGHDQHGLVLPGTTRVLEGGALAWRDCVKRFPSCPLTVGEVAPCMDRAQRGDIWFALPESAQCKPMRDCIWGFEVRESSP